MTEIKEYLDTFSQDPKTKKIERVACYIRVSTQEQKLHGISLDAQRDKLTEYAKKHNLKIVEFYVDEGISGRKLIKNRPELQRMIKDAQEGKFDRIIFIKLDRFFRSVAEYHECMKKIDPILWTATEEKYDLTTANGRAFVNMKITIAELEADQTGERIDLVNAYKVKTGQPLTGAHNQGIAYTVATIDNVKRVVPDPETKDLVTDYINHFLTHQNKRQAFLYVNSKYGTNIDYKALAKVLTDSKICGFYRGNPNYCEPYVDAVTFTKLQELLKRNVKKTPSKRVYIFSGLIKCPKCGNYLAGNHTSSSSRLNAEGERIYHYKVSIKGYRCNKHAVSKECTYKKRVNESKLETKLLNTLDAHIHEYYKNVSIADAEINLNSEAINDRIKEIKTEMKNTTTAFRKNRLTEAEYDREYEALEDQLKELESKLEPVVERDLSMYEDLLKSDWKTVYKALSDENKQAFWRKYLKEIKVGENGTMTEPIFF